MPHPNILDPSQTALVVVDMQEAFRSAVGDFSLIASRISTAVRGFLALDLPVLVTEQYPQGLGRTAEEIMLMLPHETEFFEKTKFSSCGATPFVDRLESDGVKQVVLCGIEAHICVNQTAHDLIDRGYQVHILTDCVASRFEYDRDAGLRKMFAAGATASSVEIALFELISDSKHAKFKEIQELIK